MSITALNTCDNEYADKFPFTCDLHAGHSGEHQDHFSDAPSVIVWANTNKVSLVKSYVAAGI